MKRQRGIGFLGALVLLAACANGGGDVGDGGDSDGSKPKYDGSQYNPDGNKACVSSCTGDTDCQNSCPAAPQGGVYCCDLTTNTCFATQNATCGSNVPEGGPTD